ncbi:MAG TPA: DHA2 family efflux MFS transporter permease subunit [Stellaceae bacterium]|nr:DHA2 family efflux MFS transporter permease subunit [Stellaceae bacterium]
MKSSVHSSTGSAREPRLRILIPLVIGCAFFMEGLDSTMIAVAIPDMAKSLGENPLRLNLVITTYLLSLAVFIPLSGWIADRLGARVVFCAAIAIFATGSALCGLSTSLPMMLLMRVLQGFGGAMMTPVGRLILLRSFPRSGLVSAMNWMTIPAMIGPTVGPIVGGFLTTYFSWRAIFYLNIPIGVTGVVLALYLIENFRAPAPTSLDLRGFVIAGCGLAFLEFAIENLGRPMVPTGLGALFFPAALAFLLVYVRHARRIRDPILDLQLLRIRTFRIGTVTGSLCRMGLDATPFLLPLLFQVGFGLSPLHAGLLTFSSSLGAMLVRTFSGLFLRVFGFRRLLVGNACLAAAVTAACGLLRVDTPVWLVVLLLLLSGCVRSIQYLGLNTVSYADVPAPLLSKSTSVSGVAQQLARGFGVAVGAALLAVIAGSSRVTVGDFALAFYLIALIPLFSALGFLRLSPVDGAEVSGHRRAQPRSA